MLSQCLYHMQVRKRRHDNLCLRRKILLAAKGDKALQQGLMEACRRDIFLWINLFVWQFNPKSPGAEVEPFITWDFQDVAIRQLLDAIECHCNESPVVHQHDLLWEKSREMGATWMFLIVALWLVIFHPHKQILMISKSAEAVDSPSPDSLFWKLDYMVQHLPDWMKGDFCRTKMYLGFSSGSSITGEASTGRAGVGGRATVMFIDEFSQIKEDREVLHRTSDTADCRVFNGTHMGTGTAFFELSRRPDMKVLKMHWTQHPKKVHGLYRYDDFSGAVEVMDKKYAFPHNFEFVMTGKPAGGYSPGVRSPWYDAQCRRKGSDHAIAMDLDIDPEGSVSGVFDRQVIISLKSLCRAPIWEGDAIIDDSTNRIKELLRSVGGPLKFWFNLDAYGKPPPGPYGVGADVATGAGATNSCLSFIRAVTGEQLASYANPRADPARLAKLAVALSWFFRDAQGQGAKLAWEISGGSFFGKMVVGTLGYTNVFYRADENSTLPKLNINTPGWAGSPTAIKNLILEFQRALQGREVMAFDPELLRETLIFEWGGRGEIVYDPQEIANDPSGARTNHGDRVFAAALAWKMCHGQTGQKVVGQEEEVKRGSFLWRRMQRQHQELEEAWA